MAREDDLPTGDDGADDAPLIPQRTAAAFDPDAFLAKVAKPAKALGKITDYGQRDDPHGDSLTRAGKSAIGKLTADSLAVSPDIEAAMTAAGVKLGDRVRLHLADGSHVERVWDDRTANDATAARLGLKPLRGRFDFFSPGGPHAKRDMAVTHFEPVTVDGAANIPDASGTFDPDAFLAKVAERREIPHAERVKPSPLQPGIDAVTKVGDATAELGAIMGGAAMPQAARAARFLPALKAQIAEDEARAAEIRGLLTPAVPADSMHGNSGDDTSAEPIGFQTRMHQEAGAQGMEPRQTPGLFLPKPQGDSTGAGIVRGLETTAESLTTPENLVIMAGLGGAPAVVQKAVAAGFGAMMAKHLPEQISAAMASTAPGDKAQGYTEAAATALMAALSMAHAGGRGGLAMEKAERTKKSPKLAGGREWVGLSPEDESFIAQNRALTEKARAVAAPDSTHLETPVSGRAGPPVEEIPLSEIRPPQPKEIAPEPAPEDFPPAEREPEHDVIEKHNEEVIERENADRDLLAAAKAAPPVETPAPFDPDAFIERLEREAAPEPRREPAPEEIAAAEQKPSVAPGDTSAKPVHETPKRGPVAARPEMETIRADLERKRAEWQARDAEAGSTKARREMQLAKIMERDGVSRPEAEETLAASELNDEARLASEADQSAEHSDEQADGKYELLTVVRRLGGLPAKGSPHYRAASGEIERVRSAMKARGRGAYAGTAAAAERLPLIGWFSKTALSLDELRANLNGYGFDFETPYDMLTAIEARLGSGKKHFGERGGSLEEDAKGQGFYMRRGGKPEEAGKQESRNVAATQAEAEGWWQKLLGKIGKAAGRDLRVRLGEPAALVEAGLAKEIPADAEAMWSAQQRAIYLLGKGLGKTAGPGDVLNLLHESGHAWWDTLPAKVQASLRDLWTAETRAKTGPLYEDGRLPANGDPRIETDAAEWFAERVAHANMEWAKARVAAAEHDGTVFGWLAAKLRTSAVHTRQALTRDGADAVTARMRQFMDRGAREYANAETPRFARRPKPGSEDFGRDLLSDQREDLQLVGERGTDGFKLTEEKAAGEKATEDARAKQDREQLSLFARRPKTTPAEDALFGDRIRPDVERAYLGGADVLEKKPAFAFLGRAMRRHIDRARMFYGKLSEPFRAWEAQHDRAAKKTALQEFERYQKAKDVDRRDLFDAAHGRSSPRPADAPLLYASASPAGRALIDHWTAAAKRMDDYRIKKAVKTLDPHTGKYREPHSVTDYFPRMIRPEIAEALRDPRKHVELWREVSKSLIDSGRAASDAEAYELVKREFSERKSFERFGNVERARRIPLPSRMYDYSLESARRYLQSFSERMAQIDAYGQKTGPGTRDLFDIALERANDDATRRYISEARRQAYHEREDTFFQRAAQTLNTAATGLQLGNPLTGVKNILSGGAHTVATLGITPSVRAAARLIFDRDALNFLRGAGREIHDSHTRGILHDDLMSIMEDAETLRGKSGAALRTATSWLVNYPGLQHWGEALIRTHAKVAAQIYLRDAQARFAAKPNGVRARLDADFIRRNHGDVAQIRAERGSGPATDTFLRQIVNAAQGGYRFDQAPLYLDTSAGKFFFKYQKWSTQALRNFVKNAVDPLLRPGSDVPRNPLPMIRYLTVLSLAGWGIQAAISGIFGSTDRSASLAEILRTASRAKLEALALVAAKAMHSLIIAGAGGSLANYAQTTLDVADRRSFKSPLEAPALAPLKGTVDAAMDLREQRRFTLRNANQFAAGQSSLYRTGRAILGRLGAVPVEKARQETAQVRALARRYGETVDLAQRRTTPGRVSKTVFSPGIDAIVDAIASGDGRRAETLTDELLGKVSAGAAQQSVRAKVRAAIRARQPIYLNSGSEPDRENFLDWSQAHLGPADLQLVLHADARYRDAAEEAGFPWHEPTAQDHTRAAAKAAVRAELESAR